MPISGSIKIFYSTIHNRTECKSWTAI